MLPRSLPGPLFALEMVTSVRRDRYFVLRVVYASILLFLLFNLSQAYSQNSFGGNDTARVSMFSWIFFTYFAVMQLIAVVAAGPAMAAGTIAAERERRTIEYLFTTTLSNWEIVFGKLFSRLMHLGYLVLAGLPILSIAMLMGGIAPQAIVLLMIITLSTALTVSIISITVSVWTAKARTAVVRAYTVIIFLLLLPALVSGVARIFYSNLWLSGMLTKLSMEFLAANPFFVLGNFLTTASSANTTPAWDALLIMLRNHAIICVLGIAASTWGVRRVHLAAGGKVAKKVPQRRLNLFRPNLGDRPMLWKETTFDSMSAKNDAIAKIIMALILIGVTTAAVITFFINYASIVSHPRDYLQFVVIISTAISCILLLSIAARAAGSITHEKERDCWTSLVCTPLEAREIIFAKIIGSIWAARIVFILLAIFWASGIYVQPGFFLPTVFTAGSLLILAFYASALGVMYSLWCRNSMRAMAATIATGLFLSGFYLFCLIPIFMTARITSSFPAVGCIPFLLFTPDYFYINNLSSYYNYASTEPNDMLLTYVVGMAGYTFLLFMIVGFSIKNFDRFARPVCLLPWDLSLHNRPIKYPQATPPLKLTEDTLIAEIVEES